MLHASQTLAVPCVDYVITLLLSVVMVENQRYFSFANMRIENF